MALETNKSFIFKQVPSGLPVPGQDLVVEDRPIDLNAPLDGGVLLRVLYASFDPYMRERMRAPGSIKNYIPPFDPDSVIQGSILARVERSETSKLAIGDIVTSFMGPYAQWAVIPAVGLDYIIKVPQTASSIHPTHFLGALGMPGMTAFQVLRNVLKPKKGETIFISSAAGAVGQIVGQLAKREGVTVVGSVGSDEKLDYILNELGFDAGFNYHIDSPRDALKKLAPQGIDMYFENVGGDHLEAALESFNFDGRIIVCGAISELNTPLEKQKGVRGIFKFVTKNLSMQGFQCSLAPNDYAIFQENMQSLVVSGEIKAKLHITPSIDEAPEGFRGLFLGENFGKAVLKISAEE